MGSNRPIDLVDVRLCRQLPYPSHLSAAASVKPPVEKSTLGIDVVQHRARVVRHGRREDDGVVVSREGLEERVEARSLVHLSAREK